MKTRKQLNAEYDALATPISKDMLANHYEHWGNFPIELYKMTPDWVSKLEGLGYQMEAIKALVVELGELKKSIKAKTGCCASSI